MPLQGGEPADHADTSRYVDHGGQLESYSEGLAAYDSTHDYVIGDLQFMRIYPEG